MRTHILIVIIISYSLLGLGQRSIEKTIERFNSGTVPYITVSELKKDTTSILLDTRKEKEFLVSHLKNAHWIGYKKFDISNFKRQFPNTNSPMLVYCSIGVRSEKIGEQLLAAGYTNVKNLYGGIFQWKKEGEMVIDTLNQPTEKVHAYSRYWGKLLTNAEKVYSIKPE